MTGKKYDGKGIVVGNDSIPSDEAIIATMKRMGVTAETNQIKNYISNNRHNHVTSFYYLLKKKAEKNPSILQPDKEEKRSNSPLIYKPEHKKDYFVPTKRPSTTTNNNTNKDKDTTRVNDSFNASKIVSSLVYANKNKLINNANNPKPKKDNFEKEEFKIFPKGKNSSHIEPSSTSNSISPINLSMAASNNKSHALTSRSDHEDKKFSFVGQNDHHNSSRSNEKDVVLRSSFKPEPSTPLKEEHPSEQLSSTDKKEAMAELSNPSKK